jgi:hypothetical protein
MVATVTAAQTGMKLLGRGRLRYLARREEGQQAAAGDGGLDAS